jgi:hypothetical protein
MHYPSFTEYADALQLSLDVVLADPLLARGTLRTRGPGLPIAHGGTFALTFEILADGGKYALRCFHKELDALHERYDAITQHLAGVKGPYFVGCQFQPHGITTETGTYPIVRMDWVEGQSLAAFVAEHLQDADALQQLRFSLRRLARHLRENGIAHGDIQPSNIIVQRGANLRLIDYDGLFVPGLAPFCSAELGQRNFQHPGRRARHFNAGLDAFAFSVIDFALEALGKRPDLWSQTGSGEDAFVLRAADFADPENSALFGLLSREPGLERRTRYLAAICMAPFEQIPPFEDFLTARIVPPLGVELKGDPAQGTHPPYMPPHAIVAAADFTQCCKHIGDRVELIGRIVRVVNATEPMSVARCLRVEFGTQSHDMACLKIWHDSRSPANAIPDDTWVGEWISVVGLVEPVLSSLGSAQGQKHISISITDPLQLQRLTEVDALHRLRAQTEPASPSVDGNGGVRTDPVDPVTGSRPQTAATIQPHHAHDRVPVTTAVPNAAKSPVGSRDASSGARAVRNASRPLGQRWAPWAAAAAIAALAAYALLAPQTDRDRDVATQPATGTVASQVAAPAPVQPPEQGVYGELRSQQNLRPAELTLDTVAGKLVIWPAEDDVRKRVLLLYDQVIPGLRDDAIALAHRAVFSDRDVITGFTQCAGDDAPCGRQQPFWLELRADEPPALRRVSGLWAGAGGARISATNDGVAIDLGRWNGEHRSARLTPAGNIVIARTPLEIQPLSRADCNVVARSLEACAASRDCSSFAKSAQRIPASRWTQLTRMYHESTGLDVAVFRGLCVRSCELGLTPSLGLIRSNACNGAEPGQWLAVGPEAGLRR